MELRNLWVADTDLLRVEFSRVEYSKVRIPSKNDFLFFNRNDCTFNYFLFFYNNQTVKFFVFFMGFILKKITSLSRIY